MLKERIDVLRGTEREPLKDTEKQFFSLAERIPEDTWYLATIASIVASMLLFFSQKRATSIFVGQWAPTFLLFGLFHKLLKPTR